MSSRRAGAARWLAEVCGPRIPEQRRPPEPAPPPADEEPGLARRVALLVGCLLALFLVLGLAGALLHH